MDTNEILLICAGSLFVLLLIIYIIVAIRKREKNIEEEVMLEAAYADKNLAKMEYDIAFYDVDMFDNQPQEPVRQQMTFDDIQTEQQDDESEQAAEEAIFTRVDDEGVEEITGTYNPENDK